MAGTKGSKDGTGGDLKEKLAAKFDKFKKTAIVKLKELDEYLVENVPPTKIVREKGFSPSVAVLIASLIALLIVLLVIGVSVVANLIGFVFPALESLKCLKSPEKNSKGVIKQWLSYWLVYGLLIQVEGLGLVYWLFPTLYYPVKIALLMFCFLPEYQGATKGCDLLLPYVLKYIPDKTPTSTAQIKEDVTAKAKEVTKAVTKAVEEAVGDITVSDVTGKDD